MPSNIWENVGYNCLFHTLSLYSCNKHVCSSCFSFLFLSYSSFHYQDFWSVTVVHTRTRTHIFLHYIAQSTSTATLHYQTVWNLLNYTLCKIEHPDREKGHYKRIPRQKWSRSKTIYVASKPTDSLYRIWRTAWCFRSVRVVAKSGYYQRHLRPSGRMNRRGSHWTYSRKTLHWGLLWKSVQTYQIWLQSDKKSGTLHDHISTDYCCGRNKFAT